MTETIERRFLLSIVRHLLSLAAGLIVSWGWVDADMANQFSESFAAKIVGALILFGAALWLSYRDKIWEFLKTRIGILMPPTSTLQSVVDVAENVEDKSAVARGKKIDLSGAQNGVR